MRTTINLDEDVYQFAKLYAKERGISLSKTVCELMRKGMEALQSASPSPRLVRAPNGLLILAGADKIITSDMVKAALEEDD